MRSKILLSALLIFAVFPVLKSYGIVAQFDEFVVPNPWNAIFITNNYQGVIWSNFAVLNAVAFTGVQGSNGFYNGMVSASNVALNAYGAPAEINSASNIDFLSAYLTGAWNSNLNIEVEGFRGASMVYSQVVVVSALAPTLITFNYSNINRLRFDSFGGQYAGFPSGSAEHFAMDNFTFEFVPEPSALLLTVAGALLLWLLLKRKRA